jgi:hypothetical protein
MVREETANEGGRAELSKVFAVSTSRAILPFRRGSPSSQVTQVIQSHIRTEASQLSDPTREGSQTARAHPLASAPLDPFPHATFCKRTGSDEVSRKKKKPRAP